MLRCIVIGLGLGVAVEVVARVLNLWRYHHAQTPILNVIGMFGLVMGGLAGLVPQLGAAGSAGAAFAAGLAYEILNLRVLRWWYFPGERMGFIAGHTAIVLVLAALWGATPLLIAEAAAAVAPPRATRPSPEARLEALTVRERRLLERLDTAHQVVRDLETRLQAVRDAKAALEARYGIRPLAPAPTPEAGGTVP